MRKSKADTEQTRKRIVSAAADEVRSKGLAVANVADIMKAAGLTHGGFYRHFEDRDALVAEAFAHAIASSGEAMEARVKRGGVAHAVDEYLSPAQRDALVPACVYAALGSEALRTPHLRHAASHGAKEQLEILADGIDRKDAKARAAIIMSLMVGSLMLSRLVEDATLSDRILKSARKHAKMLATALVEDDRIAKK